MQKELISTEWLNENLTDKKIVLLDSSPYNTVNGKTSPYQELSIPNSRILNIKESLTNKKSDFPNTIPSPLQFEQTCQSLGINKDSEIIVYDNLGIYTSPRVWWLFKVMGHKNVKVLNGGLIEWMKKGYDTINKSELNQEFKIGNFESDFQKEYLIDYEAVIDNIKTDNFLMVDARSKGRFDGTAPEPRKHLKSGSIPNSINIPYKDLLTDGKYKTNEELNQIFKSKVDPNKKLVFSCGSGMTACIVILASEMAFKKSRYLYDGSWTEYAEKNQKNIS